MLCDRALRTAPDGPATAKGSGLEATLGNNESEYAVVLQEDIVEFAVKPTKRGASKFCDSTMKMRGHMH